MQKEEDQWHLIDPELHSARAREAFMSSCAQLLVERSWFERGVTGSAEGVVFEGDDAEMHERWAEVSRTILDDFEGDELERLEASLLVVRDLSLQRWRFQLDAEGVKIAPPESFEFSSDEEQDAEKQRMRERLLVERDRQLREPATRDFVKGMERRSLYAAKRDFFSIYSVMRDGRELSARLSALQGAPGEALLEVIDPYIQVVTRGARCSETGLDLHDIWRYFRHTWSMAYKTAPARSMGLLIRDRAAPCHPIIGIAELRSAPIQISMRDEWIGWAPESFGLDSSKKREDNPKLHRWPLEDTAQRGELSEWLARMLDGGLRELETGDLEFITGDLSATRVVAPEVLVALRAESHAARRRHEANSEEVKRILSAQGEVEEHEDPDRFFAERARLDLYRSKRAKALADLLEARSALHEVLDRALEEDPLEAMLATPQGRHLFKRALRHAKTLMVGIAIADIGVCGAVQPYNALLGGKLVSMLMASPAVTNAYRERYAGAPSLIASAMAGRAIYKPPELVLLTTTSLYGLSSQYNRIRVPCHEVGGERGERIAYEPIGDTLGYGTDQFSAETVKKLGALRGIVNSIYGEGVSPRLRKVSAGLAALEISGDRLLRHESSRAVYGIPLARNFRRYLLGLDDTPDFYLPQGDPDAATRKIASWWARRWLSKRIERADTLARVAQHHLVHPVTHGARVPLPAPLPSLQGNLFDSDDQDPW